jgi:hypothetical protein
MAENRIGEETRARIAAAWPDILADIASGELIRDVLKKNALSLGMVRGYRDSTPGAGDQWNQAKADSADAFFDEAIAIAYNPGVDAASARVKADLFKWLAGKRNPRDYSDKATLDVNVRTVDLTRIITEANARLEASRMLGQTIEGEALRIGRPALLGDLL